MASTIIVQGLPDGDVLVHAGDFMNSGRDSQDIWSFNRWLGEQPFKHRIVCAGNHDRYFGAAPQQSTKSPHECNLFGE